MLVIYLLLLAIACIITSCVTYKVLYFRYKNQTAASDADWRKKLRETMDDYQSKLVKQTGSIVRLNASIKAKETIISEQEATIKQTGEARDKYIELYHGSEVEISNLKDQLKEAEEANDILDKQLDEARECYEATRSELETNWGKKFNDILEENSEMAKKIQDQALEIMDLKKQRDLALDVVNGKLDPLVKLYEDMQNDDRLEHPYILDCTDDKTLQEVTKFLRDNADRAKVNLYEQTKNNIVESMASTCGLPTECAGAGGVGDPEETKMCDSYIPLTPSDPIDALTEAINDNYEKKGAVSYDDGSLSDRISQCAGGCSRVRMSRQEPQCRN